MLVSFVIPAHNEEPLIAGTVQAIHGVARELGLRHEVVVADDSSTDGTARVAAAHGARTVRVERRQIAAARNAGALSAQGQVLFFIDADTTVTPGAVREALEMLKNGAVGGGGPIRFDGPIPLYARVMLGAFLFAFRMLRYTGGCFLFCTRQSFDAVGGWDETLYASEELTMADALKKQGKFRIVRTPVVTSARKLRAYRGVEILGMTARIVARGRRGVTQREGLELWYERRPDPGAAGSAPNPEAGKPTHGPR